MTHSETREEQVKFIKKMLKEMSDEKVRRLYLITENICKRKSLI